MFTHTQYSLTSILLNTKKTNDIFEYCYFTAYGILNVSTYAAPLSNVFTEMNFRLHNLRSHHYFLYLPSTIYLNNHFSFRSNNLVIRVIISVVSEFGGHTKYNVCSNSILYFRISKAIILKWRKFWVDNFCFWPLTSTPLEK